MKPELAYIVGFLQSDGHLSNVVGKGKLTMELSSKDKEILPKIGKILTNSFSVRNRIRNTNFKNDYESSILTISNMDIRKLVFDLGVPEGRKSDLVEPPKKLRNDVDYWRGYIDGDGSIGFTGNGFPFLSLNTSSDKIAEQFILFLETLTGKRKRAARNKRDNSYNICITKEDAQLVSKVLYYTGSLSLKRKLNKVKNIQKWRRPLSMVRVYRKAWSEEDDSILLAHDNSKASILLKRSIRSIKMRRWRLNNKGN